MSSYTILKRVYNVMLKNPSKLHNIESIRSELLFSISIPKTTSILQTLVYIGSIEKTSYKNKSIVYRVKNKED